MTKTDSSIKWKYVWRICTGRLNTPGQLLAGKITSQGNFLLLLHVQGVTEFNVSMSESNIIIKNKNRWMSKSVTNDWRFDLSITLTASVFNSLKVQDGIIIRLIISVVEVNNFTQGHEKLEIMLDFWGMTFR